jgi:transposase
MAMNVEPATRAIVVGVDTHKDLHVAAVVDEQDRVLGTRSFATTRQGYRQMLTWMRSFGDVQRIGVESTGSYGAGLLRFLQSAGVMVLEVTTPDRQDRRKRGKNDDLDAMIAAIVDELAPDLVTRNSIGHTGAAQLLLTAGGNPDRMQSEASFATLCGISPVPASSGKTVRHRLNRGGDRAANSALHIIAIGRLRTGQRTKEYVARRIAQGHSKLDAIRALKRYLAREVFTLIMQRQKQINATRIAA